MRKITINSKRVKEKRRCELPHEKPIEAVKSRRVIHGLGDGFRGYKRSDDYPNHGTMST
jgi:hypothetical protein